MDDRVRRKDALPRVLLVTEAEVTDSGYRRRCQHANFERIQTFPRVAVAQLCQMPSRIGVHFNVMFSEAAFGVGQGAIDQ